MTPSIPKRYRTLLMLGMIGALLAGCAFTPATPAPSAPGDPYWPTEDWRSSSPEAGGMDGQKLEEMQAAIRAKALALHSLLVIRHGYLVSETYYSGYKADTRHELYSCTKSFTSTLLGIALDKGLIQGLDQKVMDFFPARTFANPDPHKAAMTLEDLLTMRSGLDWHEGDAAYGAMVRSGDWVKYVLDEPMAGPPGSGFNYCSGCTHLLSAILQQRTGTGTLAFAQTNLFTPLGITDMNWEKDAQGTPVGGWGLQLTPREMAKLGYLFLRQGEWDGRQVVSASWVANATRQHTATDGDLGYGYQWWTYPALDGYTALGRYGQTIFVIPKADLVIVTTAQVENHDDIFKLIENFIAPAVIELH